jgi:hypothetical protein
MKSFLELIAFPFPVSWLPLPLIAGTAGLAALTIYVLQTRLM